MKLNLSITHNSGDTKVYQVQPPEWRKWELDTKQKLSSNPEFGVSDLLFLAYHAAKRENAGKPMLPLDTWCETVSDINVEEQEANFTQQVASEG
jgi:hypothetical protein